MSRDDTKKTVDKYQKIYLSLVANVKIESDLYEERRKELRADIIGKLKTLTEEQLMTVKSQLETPVGIESEN